VKGKCKRLIERSEEDQNIKPTNPTKIISYITGNKYQ